MRQQQHNDTPLQPRDAMNWLILICLSLAVTCEAFLHRRPGRRWPGTAGVGGLVIIFLFPLVWPAENPVPLIYLLFAYMAACLRHRVGSLCSRYDYTTHSCYSGSPRIMRLVPFLSELTIKRFVEPILVFIAGLILCEWSKPLGSYLIVAAWGLFVSVNMAEAWMRRRVQDLTDAVIEQKHIAERFRRSNGNHW